MNEPKLRDRQNLKKFSFLSVKYLNLLKELTLSRYKLSEQTTVMGFFWTLLYPILSVGLFYILFSENIGSGIPHYGIYLFSGMIAWNLFSNATTRGLSSIMVNSTILKNANIPFEISVFSEVFVRCISYIFEILFLILLIIVVGIGFNWTILFLPVVVLIEFTLIIAISLLLATLNVYFNDINHIWALILTLAFFTTPVIYNVEKIIPASWFWLYTLNPLASIMISMRDIIIYQKLPDLMNLGYTIMFTVFALALNFMILKKMEYHMLKEI